MQKSSLFQGLIFNWPAKILALASAILLFLIIQMASVSERTFSVPLEVILPEGFTVETNVPEAVRLTVSGPEESIYRILPEKISVSVDFSDVPYEGAYERSILLDLSRSSDISPLVTFRAEPTNVKLYFKRIRRGEESQ